MVSPLLNAPLTRRVREGLARLSGRTLGHQMAALCYRLRNDSVEILVITSLTRRRWIIPKGWPMPGKTLPEAAAIEAFEEAGVEGRVSAFCLGHFDYVKVRNSKGNVLCRAYVFPLKVLRLSADYEEQGLRKRQWVSREEAARRVTEPELKALILQFVPRL